MAALRPSRSRLGEQVPDLKGITQEDLKPCVTSSLFLPPFSQVLW